MDTSLRLSGEEWQIWADQLLTCHYGVGEYQRVPDNYKGDAGIEGFTINFGHAYQAYGPEEPLTTEERYKKHRKKIYTDINKFINNHEVLSAIFGSVRIKRWILLVPYFDSKKLLEYASVKTQEVIDSNLPYVHQEFRIVVEDENAFALERDHLINANVQSIYVVSEHVSEAAIVEWADENDILVRTIDQKASRMPTLTTIDKCYEFRNKIIKHLLEGQNVLEDLRKYPTAYENIRKAKSERERYLTTQVMISTGTPSDILLDALNEIKQAVKAEVRNISQPTVDAICWEAVSDWLARCPLDFPEVVSHD